MQRPFSNGKCVFVRVCVTAVAIDQIRRLYSGVSTFTWYYSGLQIYEGWWARKWGRLVGYHSLGLPVFIQVVYKHPWNPVLGLTVGALGAKYEKLT
jgi:hypothetical protein